MYLPKANTKGGAAGIIGAEPLGINESISVSRYLRICPSNPQVKYIQTRSCPRNASSSLTSRTNAQTIKLKITLGTRAPARRREPCICQRQIRKAEPRGTIGAEPLGMEADTMRDRIVSFATFYKKAPTVSCQGFFIKSGDDLLSHMVVQYHRRVRA